jgi:hypothetical protein
MSDTIGRITVPTVTNSGQTFPLTTQYPFGFSVERPVIVHRFGSLDAKQEQPGVVRTTASDAERDQLRRYFDLVFKEVESQGDLQVIVLEHAYFADDQRFIAAVGSRLFEDEKLIPSDWPMASA